LTLGINKVKTRLFIDSIESDARALIKEVATLSVWGKLSSEEIWDMTYLERLVLSEAIKEHTETMYGKKGLARR
jgi:hypothetical protein